MNAIPQLIIPPLMHGVDYHGGECAGWIGSRKWDGCNARWTGEALLSREGHVFPAPDWFTARLPRSPHNCELLGDGEAAGKASALLRCRDLTRWRTAKLMIFDAPLAPGGLAARLASVSTACEFAEKVETFPIADRRALRELLTLALHAGWEGLMMQPADLEFTPGRTNRLQKVKRQSLHTLRRV
jgi:DNA ligase-1